MRSEFAQSDRRARRPTWARSASRMTAPPAAVLPARCVIPRPRPASPPATASCVLTRSRAKTESVWTCARACCVRRPRRALSVSARHRATATRATSVATPERSATSRGAKSASRQRAREKPVRRGSTATQPAPVSACAAASRVPQGQKCDTTKGCVDLCDGVSCGAGDECDPKTGSCVPSQCKTLCIPPTTCVAGQCVVPEGGRIG